MNYNSGDILFLTVRPWSFKKLHRVIISKLIERISGKYVHCSIIYFYEGHYYVRDMNFNGNNGIKLSVYIDKYKNRLKRIKNPFYQDYFDMQIFNSRCHYQKNKYEYKNLFLWQLIRHIFNKWIGKETVIKRTCSEDVSRMLNILKPNFVYYPDKISPNELYQKLKAYEKQILCKKNIYRRHKI
ncbi:MAG: hypothetical protein GF317_23375 [Candidatus Lokiarchaeota archaeon]|nr:hypothetical protein [Candidatus Lokiarchaeota archaeon]